MGCSVMLKNKVVFVTGSSRGIGKALIVAFAKQGYHVVANGTKTFDTSFLKELEKTYGISTGVVIGNVQDEKACQQMKKEIVENFGLIDILINNAGVTKDALFLRMTKEDFQTCLDINLTGTFNVTKVFLNDFMKKKQGVIINMASVSGVLGNPGQVNYAASKAGIIGFTKSLARELASRNITCNAIAPGFIETDMTSQLGEKTKEHALKTIPLNRFGQVEDIAKGALYLAQSPYVTGQVLHIDGGMAM